MIRLDHVGVSRNGKALLQAIQWEIYPGQNWAVVGPNGAGKTVLMQVLQGLWPCFPGRVVYGDGLGPDRNAQESFEQQQQIVAQEDSQAYSREFSGRDGGTTVRQFLERAPSTGTAQAAADLSRAMTIEPLLDSALITLSNGEMRKVLIARALRRSPRLLILDEPYDGLDAASQQGLTDLLYRLPPLGTQLVLVTHRLEEISDVVTHLLCLQGGRVVLKGERQTVLASYSLPRPHVPPAAKPEATAERQPDEAVPSVAMKDVTVRYGGRVVLDKLNWVVLPHEHWAIVGPNGAGKTTLLRLISADHLQAYANEIYLFGRRRGSGESIWDIKQQIGVLSPELQIAYRLSVTAGQVVLSGFFDSVGLYHQASPAQRAQASEWIGRLKLGSLVGEPFDQLSYGQQRLVLLARALVKSPRMLLLDEPCQGLDPENCQHLIDTVSAVAAGTPTQILYVTHRRYELPDCITHVLELKPRSGS
jgi:molybdate transport system ATP-binding protein